MDVWLRIVIPSGARNLDMQESLRKQAFSLIDELPHTNIRNKMPKSKYFINKLSTFYVVYVVSQVSDLLPIPQKSRLGNLRYVGARSRQCVHLRRKHQ